MNENDYTKILKKDLIRRISLFQEQLEYRVEAYDVDPTMLEIFHNIMSGNYEKNLYING
jgi:hypothetical protein